MSEKTKKGGANGYGSNSGNKEKGKDNNGSGGKKKSKNTCRDWNRGNCDYTDCMYQHICAICRGAHTAQNCKKPAADKSK